jgi:hypothetical protein
VPLDVAGQLPGVVGALGSQQDGAIDRVAVAPDRRERQVRPVAGRQQADLLFSERAAKVFQIRGALLGVVGGQLHPLPDPVRDARAG